MKLSACIVWCVLIGWLGFGSQALQAQVPLAIADFVGDETGEFTRHFRQLAKQANAVTLLDESLMQVALRGAGYDGSVNLTVDAASALGRSIGCAYYVLGKVLVTRRALDGGQHEYEAVAGLFLVETRGGQLRKFVYAPVRAATEREVRAKMCEALTAVWPQVLMAQAQAQALHHAQIAQVGQAVSDLPEILRDDEIAATGVLPVFYQRFKPAYSSAAEAAGITAIVELAAVFQADGTVGEVEIVRWAGYGLDEAALATVKKLRFKPAMQHEKAIPIRGLVRYTFRRPPTMAERQAETERLKRSVQQIQRPAIPH